MNRYEKAKKLQDDEFKQIIGVAKAAFDAMVVILGSAYAERAAFGEKETVRDKDAGNSRPANRQNHLHGPCRRQGSRFQTTALAAPSRAIYKFSVATGIKRF
jgi:hypothetical protein